MGKDTCFWESDSDNNNNGLPHTDAGMYEVDYESNTESLFEKQETNLTSNFDYYTMDHTQIVSPIVEAKNKAPLNKGMKT